jgi:periplasmic mercuric ion binding protein
MKTKVLSLAALFMMGVFTVFAGDKTETFKVNGGDCEDCKTHIETTAKEVEGVASAEWNLETKQLTLVFNEEAVALKDIEMAIAKGGNDTPNFRAPDEAYDNLPECCKYDRPEE